MEYTQPRTFASKAVYMELAKHYLFYDKIMLPSDYVRFFAWRSEEDNCPYWSRDYRPSTAGIILDLFNVWMLNQSEVETSFYRNITQLMRGLCPVIVDENDALDEVSTDDEEYEEDEIFDEGYYDY
ncbi:hypothetical protein Q9L58_008688 [Maublancomyces gigas]|uniref:Uncharacterized protein n=1 Tax=Discina gigas TaxID=1032678 RepID=A0ABR3G940_9PEZI